MNKISLFLLATSFLMIGKAFSAEGASVLEQIKALKQEQVEVETERAKASAEAKTKISDLKRQEAELVAAALRESEEQIKTLKIEKSEEEKKKQAEIDKLTREAADLKKAIVATSGTPTTGGSTSNSTRKP